MQLALQADVAQNYFELRQLDSDLDLYRRTVELREQALKLVQRRFNEGDISELDVSRAKNELATAQADAVGARARGVRACARDPARQGARGFRVQGNADRAGRGEGAAGLPSALLERRPDVSAAERAMAAANARIGLAKSAYFPKLDITGAFGYEASTLGNLFLWSSRTFLLGPFAGTALTLPLFDGGVRPACSRHARSTTSRSRTTGSRCSSRSARSRTIADLRLLDDQIRAQDAAVNAPRGDVVAHAVSGRRGRVSRRDRQRALGAAVATAVEPVDRRAGRVDREPDPRAGRRMGPAPTAVGDAASVKEAVAARRTGPRRADLTGSRSHPIRGDADRGFMGGRSGQSGRLLRLHVRALGDHDRVAADRIGDALRQFGIAHRARKRDAA